MFAAFNFPSLTKVRPDEPQSWQPRHWTGSARTEGFYKISSRDKLKYLNCTKLTAERPSSSAQVLNILSGFILSFVKCGKPVTHPECVCILAGNVSPCAAADLLAVRIGFQV